jgi:hypothetical protein
MGVEMKKLTRFLVGASTILLFSISMATFFSGRASATDLPVIHVNGTLGSNQTWVAGNVYYIDNWLTVPSGVTLTIEAGAIVKAGVISVNQGGSLYVTGTSLNKVIFTSHKDDSAGGDSNGNGTSSGQISEYNTAIENWGGTVQVDNSVFRYGNYAANVNCSNGGSTIISDSMFNSAVAFTNCAQGTVGLQRNHFDTHTSSNSTALGLYNTEASDVVLSGINSNTFDSDSDTLFVSVGNGAPTVASGNVWEVSGASGVVLRTESVNVEGTLELRQGAIVKTNNGDEGIIVNQGGDLNVDGDVGNPVIFTSYKDDTVGGDTNNNGLTEGSLNDYSYAVRSLAGSVAIDDAVFRFASYALGLDCVGGNGSATVNNSLFNSPSTFSGCGAQAISMQGNEFALPSGYSNPALYLNDSVPSGIDLSGTNQNMFTGSGRGRVVRINNSGSHTAMPAGSSWDVAGLGGAVIAINEFRIAGTVNFGQATIIKPQSGAMGINVLAGGNLTLHGASSQPVTITSHKDDSIGGDSNGNGASSGAAGDYGYAIRMTGEGAIDASNLKVYYANQAVELQEGEATFNSTELAYGTIGFEVEEGAYAAIRGSIHNFSEMAVRACDFAEDCIADAAYVDWGANGPRDANGDPIICGQATVSPWIENGNTITQYLWTPYCSGSDTPVGLLGVSAAAYDTRTNELQLDCDNALQAACDALERRQVCLAGAYASAQSASPVPLPDDDVYTQAAGYSNAAVGLLGDYLVNSEQAVVTGSVAGFATQALSVFNTILALDNAYNTCFNA